MKVTGGYPVGAQFNPPSFAISPIADLPNADTWSDFHPGTRGVMIALTIQL
jgi:hypothetical protein